MVYQRATPWNCYLCPIESSGDDADCALCDMVEMIGRCNPNGIPPREYDRDFITTCLKPILQLPFEERLEIIVFLFLAINPRLEALEP